MHQEEMHDKWLRPTKWPVDTRYFSWDFEVWHYTNLSGLEGIVTSNVLWATESGGLNDPSEVVGACEDLWVAWEEIRNNLIPDAPRDQVEEWLFRALGLVRARRFFFVSACTDGDKLQHWKSYAGGKGYAVEFDRQIELRLLCPENRPKLYLPDFAPFPWWREVNYGPYWQFASQGHPFIAFFDSALTAFDALNLGKVADIEAFYDHLERDLLMTVCFHKHGAYAEEEEVRLAVPEPPFSGFVRERDGGYGPGGKTAYIELAFADNSAGVDAYSVAVPEPLPIQNVRIGPRANYADSQQEKLEIERLLSQNGHHEVQVKVSNIPFRG